MTGLLLAALLAAGPGRWEAADAAAFEKGTLEGLLVTPEGTLTLGPEAEAIWTPEGFRYVWSVVPWGDGAYAGVGNGAAVWRVARDGSAETVWAGPGAEVYALALGPDGRLWAGVSPTGLLVAVDPATLAAETAALDDSYVWSIASAGGRLFAATGRGTAEGGGRIVRIDLDDTPSAGGAGARRRPRPRPVEVYRSDDAHVLSLAPDGRGGLYFGTQGRRGVVGRVEGIAPGETPSARILFDPPDAEVTALGVGADGVLFAATAGERGEGTATGGSGGSTDASSVLLQAVLASEGGGGSRIGPAASAGRRRPSSGGAAGRGGSGAGGNRAGRLWRIPPDGAPEILFEAEGGIRDLRIEDSTVLVAGIRGGRIWRVRPDGRATVEIDLDAEAVLDLAGPLVATGRPAGLHLLSDGPAERGAYLSEPIDAKSTARWGAIDWEGEGTLLVSTRSGQTEEVDSGWSAWSRPYRLRHEAIVSPPARFLQVRVAVRGFADAPPPHLRRVSAAYRAMNRSPRIESVSVGPFLQTGTGAAQGQAQLVQLTQAVQQAAARTQAAGGRGAALPPTPNPYRTFTVVEWKAEDADEDDLVARLEIKGEDGDAWHPFADEATGGRYVFDSAEIPDGRYRVRVVVSDSPSNVPEEAREAEAVSAPFVVDNTPPTVRLSATSEGDRTVVLVEAVDAGSTVQEIAYSLDAGTWVRVAPDDGVEDSPRETARIVLRGLGPGVHALAVRATDAGDRTGFARILLGTGEAR